MAVSVTALTTGKDTTLTSTKTTASVTLTANQPALLAVHIYHTSPLPTVTSVTATGAIWELVKSVNSGTTGTLIRLELWRTMTSANQTGAVTINLSAVTTAGWALSKCSGVLTTGTNGSGAIVQSATNGNITGDTVTVTLAAFASVSNGTYGANGHVSTAAVSPGSGFTELSEVNGTTFGTLETQWRADNDTTVDQAGSGSGYNTGIAVELGAFTGTNHTQALAATSTFAPTISKGYGKLLAVDSVFAPAIGKAISKSLAVASSFATGFSTFASNLPGHTDVSLAANSVFTAAMDVLKLGKHGNHSLAHKRATNHRVRTRKG